MIVLTDGQAIVLIFVWVASLLATYIHGYAHGKIDEVHYQRLREIERDWEEYQKECGGCDGK